MSWGPRFPEPPEQWPQAWASTPPPPLADPWLRESAEVPLSPSSPGAGFSGPRGGRAGLRPECAWVLPGLDFDK